MIAQQTVVRSVATGPPYHQPVRSRRLRWLMFAVVWLASVAVTGWLIVGDRHLRGESMTNGGIALLMLLAANIALFAWLPGAPVRSLPSVASTHTGPLSLAILLIVLALFPAGVIGPAVLVPVGLAALVTLVLLRENLTRHQILYATVLGVVAAGAGTLDWLVTKNSGDLFFSLVQLPLVLVALLAGWAIARHVGWTAAGIGISRFLSAGAPAALRSFLFGMIVALPWALGNIAGGLYAGDSFRTFWQPLSALRPGIAEEAWGRVFMIAVIYLVLSRFAKAQPALILAGVIGGLWFAWLHAPLNPIGTILLAAIYTAPMIVLWLRRDVETAIGFHFSADLVRFMAAYLAFQGLWFS